MRGIASSRPLDACVLLSMRGRVELEYIAAYEWFGAHGAYRPVSRGCYGCVQGGAFHHMPARLQGNKWLATGGMQAEWALEYRVSVRITGRPCWAHAELQWQRVLQLLHVCPASRKWYAFSFLIQQCLNERCPIG